MRCLMKQLAMVLLSLGVALPAAAATPLASLMDTAPGSWAEARAAALADPALMSTVRKLKGDVSRSAEFTGESWQRAVMAEILLSAERAPDAAARVRQTRGLDPAAYLKARRPIPLATRELTRMKLSPGALFEAWMFHRAFPKSRPAGAYPDHAQARVDELRAAEAVALEEGLLTALARTRHPLSANVLLEQLQSQSPRRQQLAAVLLGETRLPVAQARLVSLLEDDRVRGPLRSAALVGLGKVRDLSALKRLVAEVSTTDRPTDERRALIGALANTGNRFAHEANPQPSSDRIRQEASQALISLLPQVASNPSLADVLAQAIATVGHESATSALKALTLTSEGPQRRVANQALNLHARARARR